MTLCGALAACGSSQNWGNGNPYVSIGGTVSGLSGTLVLSDNGTDNVTLTTNGTFHFGLQIKNGSTYSVTVNSPPQNQTCSITNGTGTATQDVSTVSVACANNPTIGGTVSGLSGTLTLQDNGGNNLTLNTNGPFTFTTPVAPNQPYNVTVLTQPTGQTCVVTQGSGTATAAVTNVAVTCTAFTLRPLPAYYGSYKAIGYGAYRAGGPGNENVSDADILQDLGLMHDAGYLLIRLFGADATSTSIIKNAALHFPDIRFQLGIYLDGTNAQCSDLNNGVSVNQNEIQTAIQLANTYSNVATVSVGNETSFANNLPVNCLAQFITTVRSQITQPVTADDDYTFYAGLASSGEKPDTILPLLDFVSIHIYPYSDYSEWSWQQLNVTAGPARAQAMMTAALTLAQQDYGQVASYSYKGNSGTTTIGAALPIVVGETGWKAIETNTSSPLETFAATQSAAATQVNQKWYYDLVGAWSGSQGGPLNAFYFDAFDESWKGTDNGWGIWDQNRNPRYALCGLNAVPTAPTCNNPVYLNAWYFQ